MIIDWCTEHIVDILSLVLFFCWFGGGLLHYLWPPKVAEWHTWWCEKKKVSLVRCSSDVEILGLMFGRGQYAAVKVILRLVHANIWP